jgi:hypothetical protein
VLAYRVWLLNSAGRTAGPSAVVYAASGAVPPPVTGLRASSTKPGVVLEWDHSAQAAANSGAGDLVELDRMLEPGSRGQSAAKSATTGSAPGESHFRARDTGGAIDRTAEPGETYRYTVQRVREAALAGRTIELRGQPSQSVDVTVSTAFPPDTPSGLVAAPALSDAGKPAIDLSWEPIVEQHIAGYRVYRRQGAGEWAALGSGPVRVAAYTDTSVIPGEQYEYRVTALNDSGMESQPTALVTEAAPSR